MNILHVDDEADIREVAALALGLDPDISVRSAASGQEALDMLAGDWRPDVVLLDVMMPGLDGTATLAGLRALAGHSETPVVFMTARAQAREQARFIDLGAVAVIVKPFDPMILARQVRDILAGAAA